MFRSLPAKIPVVSIIALPVLFLMPACTAEEGIQATIASEATAIRVIDGDTIEVSVEGSRYRLRYIGIDAPEMEAEYYAAEAAARNRELVEGKKVRLERDVSDTDRYGRLLRYVWIEGVMVNAELVKSGYARAVAYPPDTGYQELFESLERQARAEGLGIWAQQSAKNERAVPIGVLVRLGPR